MRKTESPRSCACRTDDNAGCRFGLKPRDDGETKRRILAALPLFYLALLTLLFLTSSACGRSEAGEVITLSGNIEADEVTLAFEVPGRLVERPVGEGEQLERGELVARLDPTDLEGEVARAGSVTAAARAQLDELEHGSRPEEVRQGQAALASARADLDRASADFERISALHSEGVLSRRDFDASLSARDMTAARLTQAEEALMLLRRGPRIEKIEAGVAQVAQAEASLALARFRLAKATILSPLDGTVISKHAEPGEVLAAGSPVVTVADLSQVWVRAFVEETDMERVKLGEKAGIFTDTHPGKRLKGRVSFIASEAEFTPKSVQTKRERVKLVYRVKVDVPNPDGALKPGMPVDVILGEKE